MVLCIYGFPTNVSALQFEWAWQHPTESIAVRKAASSFKSLSGIANKVKLAYTMLTLPSWQNLNLTVNFFSTKYTKFSGGCPKLPEQMKVKCCPMDELPCYVEGCDMEDAEDEECTASEDDNTTRRDTSIDAVADMGGSISCETDDLWQENGNGRGRGEPVGSSPNPSYLQISVSASPRSTVHSPEPATRDNSKTSSTEFRDNSSGFLNGDYLEEQLTPLNPSRSDNNKLPSFGYHSGSGVEDGNITINLLSPEPAATCMQSPPSCCIIRSCNKRASKCPKIIDLTGSPLVIQL
ncbi:hypothetical protein H6P81_008120 [Aristolochia fimbriata]|uniref:Structure-specific endonuclease subunit SLX1 homolog n=1 Tax=Aristolochia fimbriata TaxID=158543 RepID=A0AAV7F501_ARIFI|nr:hypothetical protein H6P81_008120 [Aristolochia fimbriata]